MPINKVALAGATGTVGSAVLNQLVEAGFQVSALTRTSGKVLLRPNVTEVVVDFDGPLDLLTEALKGHDAVVSATGSHTSIAAQLALVEAAAAAGVQRFIPSGFGADIQDAENRAQPVYADKVAVEDRLVALAAADSSFTYTAVSNNAILDFGLQRKMFLDPAARTAVLWDGGEHPVSLTRLAAIGRAIVGVLRHPDETRNRTVYVHEVAASLKEILAIAQELAPPASEWIVTTKSTQEAVEASRAALARKEMSLAVIMGFRARAGFRQGVSHFKNNDNKLLGIETLSPAEFKSVVIENLRPAPHSDPTKAATANLKDGGDFILAAELSSATDENDTAHQPANRRRSLAGPVTSVDSGIPIRYRTISLTVDQGLRAAKKRPTGSAGAAAEIDIVRIHYYLNRIDDVCTLLSSRRGFGQHIATHHQSSTIMATMTSTAPTNTKAALAPPSPVTSSTFSKKFVPPAGTPPAFVPTLQTIADEPDAILRLSMGENSLPAVRDPDKLARLLGWAPHDGANPCPPPPWAATTNSDNGGAFGHFDKLSVRADPLADAIVAEFGPAAHTRVAVPGLPSDAGVEDRASVPAADLSSEAFTPEFLAKRLGAEELPTWVDPAQIIRGQEFFWKNAFLIFSVLLHGSLAARRLMETSEMILNAFVPGELLKIGGAGWMNVVKVRLMHAGVRLRIAKSLSADPAAYSDRTKAVQELSLDATPISQADMAVTTLSFQTAVLTGLIKLGVTMSWKEMIDYTAVWRFIGHLVGVDDDANPCQWTVQTSFYLAAVYLSKFSVVYRLSEPDSNIILGAACPFAGGTPGGTPGLDEVVFSDTKAEAPATGTTDTPPAHVTQAGELTYNVLESTFRHITRQAPWLHSYYFHRIMGPTIAQRLRIAPPSKTQALICAMLLPTIRLEADIAVRSGGEGASTNASAKAGDQAPAPAPWVMPRVRRVRKFIAQIEKRIEKSKDDSNRKIKGTGVKKTASASS
ncbi:hypothetical protein HK405_004397 [Cladochytrium tenue]|nr:hypothetical protein HK405_004397 [Cladochytrium tenue]